MSVVQTVLGPVPTEELGRIMHHEHLLSLVPGPWLSGGRPDARVPVTGLKPDPNEARYADDQVRHAVTALCGLAALGIGTVVDLSPYGVVGRDAVGANAGLLQRISRESGVHVVAGTSVYLEAYSPRWTVEADLRQMTERFVADAAQGIGTSGVRAGVFGEQATSLNRITAHEEKCLRAAARAQRETGLGLTTHTTHGTMALEQLEILRQEGADLDHVVIGHMDTHADLDYVRQVARTGVHIAFDTVGKQNWDFVLEPEPHDRPDGETMKQAYHRSDVTRATRLAALVAEGFEDQILLAQDLTGAEVWMNPTTHGQWGYSYLGASFSTLLLEHGVTEKQIEKMLLDNPARLLETTARP
jgi:predicted metal-dependent phosphotriesterase family hydrolase